MSRKDSTPEVETVEDEFISPMAPAADESDDLMGLADAVREDHSDREDDSDRRRRLNFTAAVIAVLVFIFGVTAIAVSMVHDAQSAAKAETAVTKYLKSQGAPVSAVDCDSDTKCTAIIQGSTYTVVILEGDNGKNAYGVGAYTG
jgi:hypothetical protein